MQRLQPDRQLRASHASLIHSQHVHFAQIITELEVTESEIRQGKRLGMKTHQTDENLKNK